MIRKILWSLTYVLLALLCQSNAFQIPTRNAQRTATLSIRGRDRILPPTQLFSTDDDLAERRRRSGGLGRGEVILPFVLAICIWMFSIPPEFRRARICPTAVTSADCVTGAQWMEDVQNYYKNGGGIQWDFSIDPKTLEENKQLMKGTFGQ